MRFVRLILTLAVCSLAFAQQDELFTLPSAPEVVNVEPSDTDVFTREVTVIGIKRTACFGTCPVYEMVLRNDGSVRYEGERFVEKQGEHYGYLDAQTYNRLAAVIVSSNLERLKDEYHVAATDLPGTYVVFIRHGVKKVVYDYGNSGPTDLWAVQQLIDSALTEVVWED